MAHRVQLRSEFLERPGLRRDRIGLRRALALETLDLGQEQRWQEVVLHGERSPVVIANHEIGHHLSDLLGDQAVLELLTTVLIWPIAKRHRLEAQHGVANAVERAKACLNRADETNVPSLPLASTSTG